MDEQYLYSLPNSSLPPSHPYPSAPGPIACEDDQAYWSAEPKLVDVWRETSASLGLSIMTREVCVSIRVHVVCVCVCIHMSILCHSVQMHDLICCVYKHYQLHRYS